MSRSALFKPLSGVTRMLAAIAFASTNALVIAPMVAAAVSVPLAGSSLSINDPGSLTGTAGLAINAVQFTVSNVDASTAPATTKITWFAGQLPAGLTLSATGLLSGTLSASIPTGLYDVKVSAVEKVLIGFRAHVSTLFVTADLTTQISISGVSVFHPMEIGTGFSNPSAVAVDGSGHVFVADTGNNRIVEMDANGTNQTTIASAHDPVGIAVDNSGHLFVSEGTDRNDIIEMNTDGSNQTIFHGFSNPSGVAVDSAGNVFAINDSGQLIKMNADGTNETPITTGFSGLTVGVAVDNLGHVFVAEQGYGRVWEVNDDGSNLHIFADEDFSYPEAVAADPTGHVYVADTFNNRIVEFNADGSNETIIGSGLALPCGVAVDSSGHVFVANYGGKSVTLLNPGFIIPNQVIPSARTGQRMVPLQLVSAAVDPSDSPSVTSVTWTATDIPAGLHLSSIGILSGRPLDALAAGTYSIYVVATEKVTTKLGKVMTVTAKKTSRTLTFVLS